MFDDIVRLGEDAAKLAASSLTPLSDSEEVDCLLASFRNQQVEALTTLRLIRDLDRRGVPAAQGHRSMAAWLRARLRLDAGAARELAERATTVLDRPGLEQALRDGQLSLPQAAVIAEAVHEIPETLALADEDPDDPAGSLEPGAVEAIADKAEAVLIEMADRFAPYQLRRFGERILTHVAPEIGERAEEAILRRREARAKAGRSVSLSRPVLGTVYVTGRLTIEDAAIVNAALDPLCKPRRGDERTPGQRRADALVDICRLALRTKELPDNGGEPPQLTLTIPYDPLTASLGVATTDTGDRVSAATARRLACDARILPMVLGGAGQVLDAGRARRLVSGPLRRALVVRDRGCAFPDCDRPPRWCEGHHLQPWSRGGRTDLDSVVLLCGAHHGILHEPASGWRVRMAADRLPEFIPPRWIDLSQRPRRNLYHPRR